MAKQTIILKENLIDGVNRLEQSMINQANTIYVITFDYDFNGKEIKIPFDCILDFQGGSFSNGSLVGEHTKIRADNVRIFDTSILLSGTFRSIGNFGRVEWFGCYPGMDSVDFKDAYLLISRAFTTVKLSSGYYHSTKGEIQVSDSHSIMGDNMITTNILIDPPADCKYGICIGKYNGTISERSIGNLIENVRIISDFKEKKHGYCGLVIGATSRSFIRNVVIWQYNLNTSLTEAELCSLNSNTKTNIGLANVCIAFKGNSELVQIDSCSTYGDIGVGFFDNTDYVSITNSILAQDEFGFCSIYYAKSGSNVFINNTSLNLGIYGLYIDDADATDLYNSMYNFSMNNCRIEQLSSALVKADGYVIGASVYLGKLKGIGPMTFNNVMYGGTNNGIIINNSTDGGMITFNHCSMFEDTTIKKYGHILGSADKSGKFPNVYLNYHPSVYVIPEDTIKLLDERIKLLNPIEQVSATSYPLGKLNCIFAYQYDRSDTAITKESVQGLRLIEGLINLVPYAPTSGYYFLPEYNLNNINKDTFVGIICEVSFIIDDTIEYAKILFKKNVVKVLNNSDNIIPLEGLPSQTNKLYIMYVTGNYAYLYNTFDASLNIHIKIEGIYTGGNAIT